MKPPFQITHKIITLISSISGVLGKIEVSGLKAPGPKLRKQNKIKTIQGTLAIEGNTLTLDQVTAVLDGKRILGNESEVLEVQNTVKLYEQIDKLKIFSIKDFLKSHNVLMGSIIASAGSFRDKNVGVLKGSKVAHIAPKPIFVPELVDKLFDWIKNEKEIHPLIKSSIVHYEIEFIHPFEDGNGRMGRFWQSLLLFKFNSVFRFIPIESLIKQNQKKYYKTLELCDGQGESTLFIEFMLGLIDEALNEFSLSVNGITLTAASRLERVREEFKRSFFSRKDYMNFFKNVSTSTASRDLKQGIDEEILIKEGEGNQTKYKFYKV